MPHMLIAKYREIIQLFVNIIFYFEPDWPDPVAFVWNLVTRLWNPVTLYFEPGGYLTSTFAYLEDEENPFDFVLVCDDKVVFTLLEFVA